MSALHSFPDPGSHGPHLATTPVTFRRVLAAVDFSAQCNAVLQTAVQIARMFEGEIFLVNAATPAVYGTGAEPIPIETFEVNLSVAQARLNELVTQEPALDAVKHHKIVVYATVLDLIQQVVDDHEIDLVIAGSHGATGMERLALGSVAESILRTVRCPVLVVGPHCHSQPNLFSSILLATRLTPSGLRSAQYASALAERAHGKLTLLHVVEPSQRRGSAPSELIHDRLMEELEELVPDDASANATIEARVEYGKAAELIPSVALCMRSTLIVMGAREESTFADHSPVSVLAHVIQQTSCPVLTVRGHFR